MAELFTTPFTYTLTSGYTAGSGTLSVSSAAPTAIQSGTFSVRLGNTSNTVLKVTAGAATTTWTVVAEYNDANAASGLNVYGCELSPRVLSALLQQNATTYAADSGAANAYAATLAPAPTLAAGSSILLKVANANTGASTLTVNGGSALPIKKNATTALASGDLVAGQIYFLLYDATNSAWQLVGGGGGTSSGGGGGGVNAQTASYTAVSGDNGKLISFNSASSLTLTLPSSAPSISWWIAVENIGGGPLSILRNGLTIDGVSNDITLGQNQGLSIYTNGTNYFTQRGNVSAQQNVIGGSGVLVSEFVLTAAQANVTFSALPTQFRDLRVVVRGRGTNASSNSLVQLRVNGDSGANYDWADGAGFSSGVFGGGNVAQTAATLGWVPAASSSSATFGDSTEIKLFNFSDTTFEKTFNSNSNTKTANTNGSVGTGMFSGWWRNTAAITSITVLLDSGNFAAGSIISLYADGPITPISVVAGGSGALVPLGVYDATGLSEVDIVSRTAAGQSGAIFQGDFDEYQIEFINVVPVTNGINLGVQVSTNGGSSYDTGSNYAAEIAYYNSSSAGKAGATSDATSSLIVYDLLSNSTTYGGASGSISLLNPLGTSYYKAFTKGSLIGYDGLISGRTVSGFYKSASAINAIRVLPSGGGNLLVGSIRVYGVAKTAYAGSAVPLAISSGPDWPPISAGSLDDEFTGTSLDTATRWSWVNQGSASVAVADSIVDLLVPAASGDNVRGVFQTLPSPTWEVTAKISITAIPANFVLGGLALYDGTKVMIFGFGMNTGSSSDVGLTVTTQATVTSSFAFVAGPVFKTIPAFIYLRIRDDNTNLTFSYSMSGAPASFLKFYQASRTAFFGSGATKIGLAGESNNASNDLHVGCDWLRRSA